MRWKRPAVLLAVLCVLAFTQAFAGPDDEGTSDKDKPAKGGKEDAPRKMAGPKADYVGAKACKKCHFKMYKVWAATPHAKAWEALPEDKRTPDAKDEKGRACISCHATGVGAKDQKGFVDVKTSDHLLGVQCEMCHGPGSLHVAAVAKLEWKKVDGKRVRKFAEGQDKFINGAGRDCRDCHSPHFSYKKAYGPKK
jgi:hypothetical protein